jgi:hypothetical protein
MCPSIYLLSFVLTLLCGCKKDSPTASESILPSPIYFNSFESSADTVGWQGYGMHTLYADAPAEGGKQSFYVSGGCIAPHAWIEFLNSSSSGNVYIYCWGKRLIGGGSVTLRLKNDYSKSIGIFISDSVWTSYKSNDSLFCALGDTLCLELISGGLVQGSMLVDLITAKQIK